MSVVLTLHLLGIGIWMGVVGAEFAIEYAGMRDQESRIRAAELHYWTDLWVELPAFVIVLVTGALMLTDQHLEGLFLAKVIFGLLTIAFNIVCVYAVVKRHQSAVRGDVEGMDRADRVLRRTTGIIPSFLIAFALGAYFVVR